jgi:hypothetical protein
MQITRGRMIIGAAVVLIIAVVTVAGATYAVARFGPSGNPVVKLARSVFPQATSCPGAEGPNSTWSDIVHAQFETPLIESDSGQLISAADKLREDAAKSGDRSVTPEQVIATTIDLANNRQHSSNWVPAGGDARFAQAVCDAAASTTGSMNALASTALSMKATSADRISDAAMGRSPLLIRGLGRMLCSNLEDGKAPSESVDEPAGERLKSANADQDGYKAARLAELDKNLATLKANVTTNDNPMLQQAVADGQASRQKLANTPASTLVAGLRLDYEITLAAHRYQCPIYSVLGYGPTCGEYRDPVSGVVRGTVVLRNSRLTCQDGLAALANVHARAKSTDGKGTGYPGALPDSSPLAGYTCTQYSTDHKYARYAVMTCTAKGGGNPDPDPEGIGVRPLSR